MDLPNVIEVAHQSIVDRPADAVVSPANSATENPGIAGRGRRRGPYLVELDGGTTDTPAA
jgi:hypothetical protein